MAISFANAPGNCFNRIGKVALLLKQVESYQSSQKTNLIDTANGVVAQLNAEPDIQSIAGNGYINALNSAGSGIGGLAQALARAVVNRSVFRDNPRPGQSLTNNNTVASIAEIIRQMKQAGASVLAMTITAVPTAFTGTGNGIVNYSVRRPFDGLVLENSYGETVLLTCNADSYLGGATAGNEGFIVTGQGAQSNVFAFNWPLGSGARLTLNAINGNANNSQGNLLTNSGFAGWTTPNIPNNFTLDVGVAGTNTVQETGLLYGPNSSLKIIGDAPGTLTQLRQQFGVAAGTPGSLSPLSQYSFNAFMRRDAIAAGAGVLTVELVDGGGNVINDANGAANSFTINLTTLTTNYASQTGVFRTPLALPAQQYLRLRLSTALTNGRAVYLAKMSLGGMSQLAANCPWVAVHSGSVPFTANDFATLAITNSRGSGGTIDTFQTAFGRLLGEVFANEFLLPSSATPTIADSLIG